MNMDIILDGVGHMSTSEWSYVRTNSKDERVFRRNTNESLSFVTEYLDYLMRDKLNKNNGI